MRNKKVITLSNQKTAGSVLPQLLVAAGVIAGLSLGVMNMTRTVSRSQESMENRYQMSIIEDEIRMALRSRLGCRRSVGGSSVTASPGEQISSIRDGFGSQSDSGRRIISIDDIIGRTVDSSGDKNMTTPEFTVTDIRVTTYADEDGPASSEGTTTSYVSGTAETYDYGPAIVSVYFEKGDDTRANNEDIQEDRSYGIQSFQKDFPIRVLVDSSSEIADCYYDENNVVEQFCDSLDGIWSDGLCKEIKIEEDPLEPSSVYAINSQASMLVESEGAVVVGDFDPTTEDAGFPEPAHMYLENDAFIGGHLDVGLDLRVVGDESSPASGEPLPAASIKGNVGIGTAAGGTTNLIVAGDSGDPAKPGVIIDRDGDTVEILNSSSESVLINNTNAGGIPALRIDLTDGNTEGMIEGGASERFEIDYQGRMKIINPGGDGDLSLQVGTSTSPYFPAYIRNQPTEVGSTASYSSNWDITGDRGDEMATKKWAASSVYAHLASDSEGVIVGNIVSVYKDHNQLDAINEHICETSRLTMYMGAGGNAQSSTLTGSYSGGVCSYESRHCRSGSERCGVLYTSGVNSDGEIFTNDRVRVQSGTNRVLVRDNGTIEATNTISSSTLVRAPRILGTGTTTSSGICSSAGCARQFGYDQCPKDTAAVGVSYGEVLCGTPAALEGQGNDIVN